MQNMMCDSHSKNARVAYWFTQYSCNINNMICTFNLQYIASDSHKQNAKM